MNIQRGSLVRTRGEFNFAPGKISAALCCARNDGSMTPMGSNVHYLLMPYGAGSCLIARHEVIYKKNMHVEMGRDIRLS